MRFTNLIVVILILIVLLLPSSTVKEFDIPGLDKIYHMIMFATWAVAVRYDFDRLSPFPYWVAISAGVVFSLVTEVLQLLVGGRSFDVRDIFADVVGLCLGFLLSVWILRLIRLKK